MVEIVLDNNSNQLTNCNTQCWAHAAQVKTKTLQEGGADFHNCQTLEQLTPPLPPSRLHKSYSPTATAAQCTEVGPEKIKLDTAVWEKPSLAVNLSELEMKQNETDTYLQRNYDMYVHKELKNSELTLTQSATLHGHMRS